MTPNEFRELALSFPEAIESAHMRHPDFRVGGKIFATLGYPNENSAMVKLSPNEQKEFVGEQVITYEGIPIIVDDFMPDNEVQGSSGAIASSVYALKTGMSTGVMGLQHGGLTVETIGELETKDATRHRLKWYCGLALFSDLGIARLQGIL